MVHIHFSLLHNSFTFCYYIPFRLYFISLLFYPISYLNLTPSSYVLYTLTTFIYHYFGLSFFNWQCVVLFMFLLLPIWKSLSLFSIVCLHQLNILLVIPSSYVSNTHYFKYNILPHTTSHYYQTIARSLIIFLYGIVFSNIHIHIHNTP